MASKSDSEHDSEEQWDDMAIVRAFEEALRDQHSRSSTTTVNKTGRKQKAAASRSNDNDTSRNATIDEEDEVLRNGYEHPAARVGSAAGANPFASQQQQQYQQSDLYQAAYAQAYAQLQGQFQTAYPAPTPQPYAPNVQMPVQSPYYPPQPPISSIPTPFPAAQGPGFAPTAAGPDDGLANVLMAWYQSGYYTGRFQAMQELKLRGQR